MEIGSFLRRAFSRGLHETEIVDTHTGPAVQESWKKGSRLHRLDGPAYMLRDVKSGMTLYETWYENGRRSRNDGPALILRDPVTGYVTCSEWWKDDEFVASPGPPAAIGAPKLSQ